MVATDADRTAVESFREFFERVEEPMRRALTAAFGLHAGREAAAEAAAYGWEHWERIRHMENPAGYLFVVGRNAARRAAGRSRAAVLPEVPVDHQPWVEPGLPGALAHLSPRQRAIVALVHGYGYSLAEAADTLGISKTTAQNHEQRAMRRLRRTLGVER
jgi:RNA polymerase sigma-70 factor (ECF subfamily)